MNPVCNLCLFSLLFTTHLVYHRNIETIINTLIDNGFIIDKILEPKPSKEAIEKNPKYVNQYDRPFFLFVRVKKGI